MYDTLIIKVDTLPGSDVSKTIFDMIELAKKLDVMVETEFNGCNIYISKNSKLEKALDAYNNYLKHVAKPSLDSLS